jgi:phenylpropionate dioxygenase-like ring-hydroxylating dioxygenase large terminal subunit
VSVASYREARKQFEPPVEPLSKFASADVVCEGWYAVGRSGSLPRGTVKRVCVGPHRLVAYRALDGSLHAVERHCGHLGADLSTARVVDKGLECSFHRWCWGPDGSYGAHRIRKYAVRERWGTVWIWAGHEPQYELPEPAQQGRVLRLPPQRLDCHPHMVLGNGLDFTHVGGVHGFHLIDDPAVDLQPPKLTVTIHGRFGRTLLRKLLLLDGQAARWRFQTIGPSLAWLTVESPTTFELLWAARPRYDGSCGIQTFFFLPRRRALWRALPMMIATTRRDRAVLEGLRFRSNFVASDAVFYLYARLIEDLPVWRPTEG